MADDILDFLSGNDNIIDEILAEVKLYNNTLSASAEASKAVAPDTKLTEKVTQDFNFSFDSPSIKTTAESEISKKLNNNTTFNVSDTASVEMKTDDVVSKYSQSVSTNYDDGILQESLTVDSGVSLSMANGFEATNGMSHQISHGGVTNTESISNSFGFDGNKATFGTSYDTSTKIGNDDYFVENTANYSAGFGTDGSFNQSSTVGTNVKAGPVEANSSVSVDSESTENSESTSVEAKSGFGVQTSEGTKLTHETSVKNSESVTEGEEETTTEEEVSVESKTRIEVDYEKASAGQVVGATVFNAAASVTEGIFNTAMSSKSETVEEHDNGKEEAEEAEKTQKEAEKAQEEADKEQARVNAEVEAEAEAGIEAEAQAQSQDYSYDYGYGY